MNIIRNLEEKATQNPLLIMLSAIPDAAGQGIDGSCRTSTTTLVKSRNLPLPERLQSSSTRAQTSARPKVHRCMGLDSQDDQKT